MIDEKGRLFGKINIIDLLVIVVVLIVAVALGIRLLGKSDYLPTNDITTRIEYTVKVTRVLPEVYEGVQAHLDDSGIQCMADGAMIDAYVTGVTAQPNTTTAVTDDGQYVVTEDPMYLDLYFTLEGAVSNTITQLVGTQEVRVGRSHFVKTLDFELTGTVTSCQTVEGTDQ